MKGCKKIIAMVITAAMIGTNFLPVQAQEVDAGTEVTNTISDTTGWQGSVQEGNRCYILSTGEKVTGLQEVDGELYYFDANGIMQTGWIEVAGNTYYFTNEDGRAYRNTTQVIDGEEYVFSMEGIASRQVSEEEPPEEKVENDINTPSEEIESNSESSSGESEDAKLEEIPDVQKEIENTTEKASETSKEAGKKETQDLPK